MHIRTCEACGASYSSKQPRSKYCSPDCRQRSYASRHRRSVHGKKLPVRTVRFIAENSVAGDLLKKGYAVFQALTPECVCHLVAIKGENLYKIEVKTGYRSPTGRLCYPSARRPQIDIVAVWERNSGAVYYLTPERELMDL